MTQNNGALPFITNVYKRRAFRRSQVHVRDLATVHHWCRKQEVYSHRLRGNGQRQLRQITTFGMPICVGAMII